MNTLKPITNGLLPAVVVKAAGLGTRASLPALETTRVYPLVERVSMFFSSVGLGSLSWLLLRTPRAGRDARVPRPATATAFTGRVAHI
jgi:hypothetical protein